MDLQSQRKRFYYLIGLIIITIASGLLVVWFAAIENPPFFLQLGCGVLFTLSAVTFIWQLLDPETAAARQSDELLQLTSQMLDCTKNGMTFEAAQRICELLLPATPAIAVAITSREVVMGYAGYNAENNEPGRPIRTTATRETLGDGKPRILHSTENIGLPLSSARISAAIIQPLYIGRKIEGTLKFYYRKANQLSPTQQSLAHGFAEVLSTQMAASALEEQTKLATSMELKMLQAQINPHFLFNTINTIASLIRTDPAKARVLLRDFAVFYRSTLEDSNDLIPLERELRQVERYFSFEVARFGEDRLKLEIEIEPEVYEMLVPSFLIQPMVENAVKHAMKSEGQLIVRITGVLDGENAIISVSDNGAGMSEETRETMTNPKATEGLGMAVRNVRDRMRGYFGPDSRMEVTSVLGEGTTVSFTMNREVAAGGGVYLEAERLEETTVPDIPQPVVE